MKINGYIKKFGNKRFTQMPFNDVDALIFSQFSYINFKYIVGDEFIKIKDLKNITDKRVFEGSTDWKYNKAMLQLMSTSPRYKDLSVGLTRDIFSEELANQFFAMTILMPKNEMFITFRGTDTSIAGWKEDMVMSYEDTVLSEEQSLQYLYDVLKSNNRKFYLGGHSKGGYLAYYVAVNMGEELEGKLIKAYSFDGPGFRKGVTHLASYQRIKEKLVKYLTFNDVIGLLYPDGCEYKVVYSNGFMFGGHDPFFWELSPKTGEFSLRKDVSNSAKRNSKKLMTWLNFINEEEKALCTEALFLILSSCQSVYDLPRKGIRSLVNLNKILKEKYTDTQIGHMRSIVRSLVHHMIFFDPDKKQLKNKTKTI